MTENTTASGAADSPKLRLLLDSFPEQNPRNLDPDAAIQLNEWGIAIVEELYRLRTIAAFAPVAPTQPDWRELCRRLYVELFHCDKQMTCSLNEDGEPIWRTGTEVRDVLSDAKAALEANPITPEAAPVAPTPPGYALVPLKVPASLYPRLTGYEKPAPGDHHRDHDRQEIESRSAKAWGEIVQAASTQPSTHARNDALADEIVELLDSCECLENGQKENALAIVKRMCSAQFEHSEAQ